MLPAFRVQFVDLFLPGHRRAARTGIQFAVGFLAQFPVMEGGHGLVLVLHQGAGRLGMVVLTASGIVVQEQVVGGIIQFPVQVVPDDDLGVGLAGKMVP